jgi:hypothetical protein
MAGTAVCVFLQLIKQLLGLRSTLVVGRHQMLQQGLEGRGVTGQDCIEIQSHLYDLLN